MRGALKQLRPSVYLGTYLVATTLLLIAWTSFLPRRFNGPKDKLVLRKYRLQTATNPAMWFVGEIAQAFAQAALPIYTLVSIGSVTFGMDITSDLINRRILFNFRTLGFILIFVTGLGLAVYSA